MKFGKILTLPTEIVVEVRLNQSERSTKNELFVGLEKNTRRFISIECGTLVIIILLCSAKKRSAGLSE